jgi:hypothetical protein
MSMLSAPDVPVIKSALGPGVHEIVKNAFGHAGMDVNAVVPVE